MDCNKLLWPAGVAFLGGVALDAVYRYHPTAVNEFNIELSGFDQRGNPRSGDFEVQRCVFKCSARRLSRTFVVDFD